MVTKLLSGELHVGSGAFLVFNKELCIKMYMVLQTSRSIVLLSKGRQDLMTSVCRDSTGHSAAVVVSPMS